MKTALPTGRAAKKRFDEDAEFKVRSREAVTRLQGGDPLSLAAWQRICDASRNEFNAIYSRLGVTLTERGESFYNPMLSTPPPRPRRPPTLPGRPPPPPPARPHGPPRPPPGGGFRHGALTYINVLDYTSMTDVHREGTGGTLVADMDCCRA